MIRICDSYTDTLFEQGSEAFMIKTYDNFKRVFVAIPAMFASRDVLDPGDLLRMFTFIGLSRFNPCYELKKNDYYMYLYDGETHQYIRNMEETFFMRGRELRSIYSYTHDDAVDILMGFYSSKKYKNNPTEYANRVIVDRSDDYTRITINTVSPTLKEGHFVGECGERVYEPYPEGVRLSFDTVSYRITVNHKTGFTYFFTPMKATEKGYIPCGHYPRLTCATSFFIGTSSREMILKYKQILHKHFVKQTLRSEFGPDIEEYLFGLRYPFRLCQSDFMEAFRIAARGISRNMDPHAVYDRMATNLHMKNTASFRRIMTDTDTIGKAAFMRYIGFRNQEIILNAARGDNGMDISSCGHSYTIKRMKETRDFFKAVIAQRGEAAASRMFIPHNDRAWLLYDTIRMYSELVRRNEPYNMRGSLIEIHDDMAATYRYIKYPFVKFSYRSRELKLQNEIDGYQFKLPSDSHELIDIGYAMHNCVGSYSGAVLNGRSIIVVMKKQDKYVGCIELSNTHRLLQALAHHNSPMTGGILQAFNAWAGRNKIRRASAIEPDLFDDEYELPFEIPG